MNRLLHAALGRIFRHGSLEIVDAQGQLHRYGDGSGTAVRIRFASPRVEWAILLSPELKVGECFMDGGLTVEQGSVYDLVSLFSRNVTVGGAPGWVSAGAGVRYFARRLHQLNSLRRSKRNVARHYDLDARLFSLFLDEDLQYSCAYFETDHADLEEAQLAKKRHIAAKLLLKPGQRVLDIGSGWGGLALYLAEHAGVEVTGITLSEEQLLVAKRRAAERGLDGRVRFLLQDYREVDGQFDRIVSVGMFEHVGVGRFPSFFATCRKLLAEDGVMLLHSISRSDGPSYTNPWVGRYIFPGGYIPAVSEAVPAIEKAGLRITDIEILRLHYAMTLSLWRQRFMANREAAREMYDERFCRMWEFYLAVSEAAFRHQGLMNFQIQMVRDQDALPITRGYMQEAEERLRLVRGSPR
jgi:cyclopropane-fatty-acyl-phospholipid synthase